MNRPIILFLFLFLIAACRQEDHVLSLTTPDTLACNNIRNYLERVSREITKNSLGEVHSLNDWQNGLIDYRK